MTVVSYDLFIQYISNVSIDCKDKYVFFLYLFKR